MQMSSNPLPNTICCNKLCACVQAQQQAELAKQAEAAARAAEEDRAKAQQEASAALARAEKEAAATLQEAQAKAAKISQEQEDRTKLAAEGAKQQVRHPFLEIFCFLVAGEKL